MKTKFKLETGRWLVDPESPREVAVRSISPSGDYYQVGAAWQHVSKTQWIERLGDLCPLLPMSPPPERPHDKPILDWHRPLVAPPTNWRPPGEVTCWNNLPMT